MAITMLEKKKGGPYTKDQQRKRRDEVYRLHFEYNYSARKIAEFLKINRGTINRDIMYWHSSIVKKWRHMDPEVYVMTQVERLEIQKARLRKQLEDVKSFQERIVTERFILDMDMKIASIQVKLVNAKWKSQSRTALNINKYFESKNIKTRVIEPDIFFEVSEKAREKISKIYNEDIKF